MKGSWHSWWAASIQFYSPFYSVLSEAMTKTLPIQMDACIPLVDYEDSKQGLRNLNQHCRSRRCNCSWQPLLDGLGDDHWGDIGVAILPRNAVNEWQNASSAFAMLQNASSELNLDSSVSEETETKPTGYGSSTVLSSLPTRGQDCTTSLLFFFSMLRVTFHSTSCLALAPQRWTLVHPIWIRLHLWRTQSIDLSVMGWWKTSRVIQFSWCFLILHCRFHIAIISFFACMLQASIEDFVGICWWPHSFYPKIVASSGGARLECTVPPSHWGAFCSGSVMDAWKELWNGDGFFCQLSLWFLNCSQQIRLARNGSGCRSPWHGSARRELSSFQSS